MKMEGIELYPHNQKAYDNLCAMLSDSNRACVVQPTGTGKFVIIAKMAQRLSLGVPRRKKGGEHR